MAQPRAIDAHAQVEEGGPRPPIIDIHAHYMPPEILSELHRDGRAGAVLELGLSVAKGTASVPIADLDARADWMRQRDIGLQLLGPEMRFARYELPPTEGAAWARRVNEAMLKSAHKYGIYVVIAMVPMQDGDAAARELEYAVSLGCRGAMVHSRAPMGLHDVRMDPFWAAASELDVPVLIHSGLPCEDERLDAFKLNSAASRPHEITVAACQLIFGGVLDRFPSLDLVLLMAGGTLPYLMPRLDAASSGGRCRIKEPRPSAYLERFYFDSLAYGREQLGLLLALVGAYRVMIGTDWPINLHESDPLRLLRNQGLTTDMWQGILSATATELFRLGELKGA